MQDNITNVFGAKFMNTLVPFKIVDREEEEEEGGGKGEEGAEGGEGAEDGAKGGPASTGPSTKTSTDASTDTSTGTTASTDGERSIEGLISKAGEGVGRSDNDRQFFFLNGRPIEQPQVGQRFGEQAIS